MEVTRENFEASVILYEISISFDIGEAAIPAYFRGKVLIDF
jgi:hypothetical protein